MKKIKTAVISFMVILLFASGASALEVNYDLWSASNYNDDGENYNGENGFEAFQVTGMYDLNDSEKETNLLTGAPYEATGRAAFFVGNVENNHHLPSVNIGQENDGLLNGDDTSWTVKGTTEEYTFNGTEFITQFQDVDGDGNFNDPGWIYLGKQDLGSGFEYGNIGPYGDYPKVNIVDLINISLFDFTYDDDKEISGGKWSLTPNPDILTLVKPLLGNNYFDHLAIIIKSSDYFAVYDLDFHQIFKLEGLTDEFFVPVLLEGTFDNRDMILGPSGNPQGISHISFWAHDPVPSTTVVPEPATLILLGSGLLGLAVCARQRKR